MNFKLNVYPNKLLGIFFVLWREVKVS